VSGTVTSHARFAYGPGYLSGPIRALAIRTKKSNWFPGCWHLRSLDRSPKDLVEVRVPMPSGSCFPTSESMETSGNLLTTGTFMRLTRIGIVDDPPLHEWPYC